MERFDLTVVEANQPYGFMAGPDGLSFLVVRQGAASFAVADCATYDLIVRGGYVVDGTGLPRRRVDVGIRRRPIAALAHLDDDDAREKIDADGMIVAPGIVDVHTHYDPQITFDPYATMSCFHGVTTVVAGNCGFSVAPCKPEDREFLSGIFARVENMDPDRAERDHVGRVRDVPRVPRQPRRQARRELRAATSATPTCAAG